MQDRSGDNVAPKNTYYPVDIRYALQMCQWTLKPIGVWYLIHNRATRLEQLVSIGLSILCFCGLFFILIPSGRFFFFEGAISTKLKLIGPVGFCLSATIKYVYLGLRGTIFARCIEHLERDWKMVQDQDHRSIMLKCVSFSRSLIVLCEVFLFVGGISYYTIMQFLSKETKLKNSTVKPLAYPGYDIFFDAQVSPIYEIVFCVHLVTAMVMYTITTGVYSLVTVFVTHISGQMQIQIARLNNLVKELSERDNRNPLAIIVYNHVEILRFSGNVESVLQEICFTEIVESTVNMCMLEYYCLMEWRNGDMVSMLTFLSLLISYTFNIFMFCYIGEVLTEQYSQCSQIGTASYEIDWYNLSAKRAHDLILLSAISQNPPRLTAGKIIELSLNTFSAVLKSSIAYLNLLRTLID